MRVGWVGGAAIADGEISIFVGSTKVANMFNNDAGDTVLQNLAMPVGGIWIPRGVQLSVLVESSTGADNYTLLLDIKDM